MYAVVSSGGKQYRVEPGTTLTLERLGVQAGAPVTFDRVLLVGDGDEVTVGTPVVAGASVSATVLGEELGPKLVIFKFKQKVKYRRRAGHRQRLVRVRIDAIDAGGRKAKADRPRKQAPAKAPAEAAAEAPVEASAEPKPRRRRTGGAKAQPAAEDSPAAESAQEVSAQTEPKPPVRRAGRAKSPAQSAEAQQAPEAEEQ